jgi:hypothetical protein
MYDVFWGEGGETRSRSSLILKLGILRCVYLWAVEVLGTFIWRMVGLAVA